MRGESDHLTIIDGPYGQGEGQISRTFLPLSATHQKSVTLQHIRTNRHNPRLRPQHLKGVEAVAHVTGAKIERARA